MIYAVHVFRKILDIKDINIKFYWYLSMYETEHCPIILNLLNNELLQMIIRDLKRKITLMSILVYLTFDHKCIDS